MEGVSIKGLNYRPGLEPPDTGSRTPKYGSSSTGGDGRTVFADKNPIESRQPLRGTIINPAVPGPAEDDAINQAPYGQDGTA